MTDAMFFKQVNLCFFTVGIAVLLMMDLSEEQETLGGISSEAFSASSEILSEERHSLMTCPTHNCTGVHVSSVKQGSVTIYG